MNYVKKQVQRSSRNRMILCGSLGAYFLIMIAVIFFAQWRETPLWQARY